MKNSKFLKGLTLLGFVLMLSAFVAYRSGTFNNSKAELTDKKGYVMQVDSPTKETMMPSSKSGPVFEAPTITNGTFVPQTVMPSSKSAGVFHKIDIPTVTLNPAPDKKNNNNKNKTAPANNASNSSNVNANPGNKPK